MGDQRDPAVAGHHQGQADQPQVGSFLLGLTPLRDQGTIVGRVDVGREVGHVQHQPGQVKTEFADYPSTQLSFDHAQVRLVQAVHRLPEPAVI